jgi:hypothetical protein
MRLTNWKAIAEFVGISAIVASLIFVGFQVQQDRRVAESQVNMAALEIALARDAAISEHADIWVKARNMQDLSEEETEILERLVRMAAQKAFLGALATLRIRDGAGPYEFRNAPGQVMDLAIMLHENAGAKKVWSELAVREEEYYEETGLNFTKSQFNVVVRDFLRQLQE